MWTFSKTTEDAPAVLAMEERGRLKFLEDPNDPAKDALAAFKPLWEKAKILIMSPVSFETLRQLSQELPFVKQVIIVDTNVERLNTWLKEMKQYSFMNTSGVLLKKDINADRDALLKIMEKEPISLHLWQVFTYFPRRFERVDKELSVYTKGLLQFTQTKVQTRVNYQLGETWHHIVNQLLTMKDKGIKKHIFYPQNSVSRPFVICGAGPSLDKNIEELKKHKDKVIILACERAIGTFKKHDLKPDFICSVENIIMMWRHYEQHLDFIKDIPLIAPWLVSHVVARNYPGDRIFLKTTLNDSWLGYFGGALQTDVGNCVGHYTYHVAEILNPSKIVLVGNDLAFNNGQTHTSSTHSDVKKEGWIVTEGFYGDKVETSSTFWHYIQRFTSMFRTAPCPIVNATEGGAYIKGAEHMSFEEAIADLPSCPRLKYNELTPSAVSGFYDQTIEQITAVRDELLKCSEKLDLINKAQPEPFFDFIPDNIQVLLNHFLNPYLYMEYYDQLQNYLPEKFESFKEKVTALVDESLRACEFILTLDEIAAYDGGDRKNCLILQPEGQDIEWIIDEFPELNFTVMAALADLPEVWHTILDNNIGQLIAFNGQLIPDSFSVNPTIYLVDIRTDKEACKGTKTYRTPNYTIAFRNIEDIEAVNWAGVIDGRFEKMTITDYFSTFSPELNARLNNDIKELQDKVKCLFEPGFDKLPLETLNELYKLKVNLTIGARIRLARLFACIDDVDKAEVLIAGIQPEVDLIKPDQYIDYATVYLAQRDEDKACEIIDLGYSTFDNQQDLYARLAWQYFWPRTSLLKTVEFCEKDYNSDRMSESFKQNLALTYSKINSAGDAVRILVHEDKIQITSQIVHIMNHMIWGNKINDAKVLFNKYSSSSFHDINDQASIDALKIYFNPEEIINIDYCSSTAVLLLSECLIKVGAISEAKHVVDLISKRSILELQHDLRFLGKLFRCLLRLGQYDACDFMIENIPACYKESPHFFIDKIKYYRLIGDRVSLESIFGYYSKAAENSPYYKMQLAMHMYFCNDEYDKAEEIANNVINHSSYGSLQEKLLWGYQLAIINEGQGDHEKALARLKESFGTFESFLPYFDYVRISFNQGNWNIELEQLLEIGAAFAHPFNLCGILLTLRTQEKSVDKLDELLTRIPNDHPFSNLWKDFFRCYIG